MCANAAIRHKQLYFNQETVWTFFLFFNPYSALLYYFFYMHFITLSSCLPDFNFGATVSIFIWAAFFSGVFSMPI